MASDLVRFSVTMPEGLLEQLDAFAERRGTYTNRSEVLRDLVREKLVEERRTVPDEEVVGSITMVYDHRVAGLAARLDKIQHRHSSEVVSSMHVYLDGANCLLVIAVRGRGRIVANMADCLLGLRGVRHGELTCVATSSVTEPADEREAASGEDEPRMH